VGTRSRFTAVYLGDGWVLRADHVGARAAPGIAPEADPMSADDLTIHERITIQMEYAVPLVRELQRILGEDVVNAALEERVRRDVARAAEGPTADANMSLLAAATAQYAAGNALEYEILASDDERFDVNVTRCGYREMMERMDARDLGHLLICNLDFPMAVRAGLELERTQTCMQGASHCDFRYRKRR
jgi:predicted ArsR family transcriptional regulator